MDQKIAPKDLIVGEKYFIKQTNCFQEWFNGTFKCLIHRSRNINFNYSGHHSDYEDEDEGDEEEEEEEEEDYGYDQKQKQHEKENIFIVGDTMLWYSVHMVTYNVEVEFDCRNHAFYKYVIV